VTELKRKFEVGGLGKFLRGTAYYSKGLMHKGSHAIDLLRFIFGDAKCFLSIKKYLISRQKILQYMEL